MRKLLLPLILFFMFFSSYSFGANENEYGFKSTQEYPFDKKQLSIPPSVQEKRYKLDIDNEKIDKTRRKIYRNSQIMEGTLDISLLQRPLKRTLRTVDTIYLHPSFITQIVLPKDLKFENCLPSFETTVFHYQENILRLQPSRNANNGNISITVTDGIKNYLINIFVKKYFNELECVKGKHHYKCTDDYLSTIINYRKPRSLDNNTKLQIVEEYLKLHNLERLTIKDNLSYVALQKNGETFYIVRDDEFGDIFMNGLALSIKDSIN